MPTLSGWGPRPWACSTRSGTPTSRATLRTPSHTSLLVPPLRHRPLMVCTSPAPWAPEGTSGVASEADLVLAGWPATLLPAEWWPVIRPGYNTDPEEMIEVTDDNALRGGITVLAESGASVINVSQGAPSAAAQLDVDGAQESARNLGETVGHALTRLVKVYPDTLIVAAAGNSACTQIGRASCRERV